MMMWLDFWCNIFQILLPTEFMILTLILSQSISRQQGITTICSKTHGISTLIISKICSKLQEISTLIVTIIYNKSQGVRAIIITIICIKTQEARSVVLLIIWLRYVKQQFCVDIIDLRIKIA